MNIPQELINKIIDQVWDSDSPSCTATKAASLTLRSWVERSQHHLFHDIHFSIFGPSFRHWCDAVSPGLNRVSRHVRTLTIKARGTDRWWINVKSLKHSLLFFISFQNVRVLRVCNWDTEPFPPEILTRCFASFAGSVRVLQWDPHMHMSRESWTHVIGLFPLVNCPLLFPSFFPTGLLSGTPAGSTGKKLILSGDRAAQCLAWGEGSHRFLETYIRGGPRMTLDDIIPIVNRDVDWLEILSITGLRRGWISSACCAIILNSLLLH